MADKKINISLNISAQTQDLKTKVQDIQKTLNAVTIPGLDKSGMVKDLTNLENRLDKLTKISNKPGELLKASDLKQAEKEIGNIQSEIKGTLQYLERIYSLSKKEKIDFLPDNIKTKIKNAIKAVDNYNLAIQETEKRALATANAHKKLQSAQKILTEKQVKKDTLTSGKTKISDDDYQILQKQISDYNKLEVYRKSKGLNWKELKKTSNNQVENLNGELVTVKELYNQWKQLQNISNIAKERLKNVYSNSQLNSINSEINTQKDLVKALDDEWKALGNNEAPVLFEKIKTLLGELGINLKDIGGQKDLETLLNRFETFNTAQIEDFDREIDNLSNSFKELSPGAENIQQEINKTSDSFNLATQKAQEFASLKSQVLSFFTITGAIQLFRRAIDSAFETVKELDEAMTEIAVVSDFSVGDMWKQLPKFTEQANQLGKSIRDVYGATTLYVQQGLDLDNSLKLANETLKMAAVAGMDAVDAADAMTSALRGFNMELSETSAQKVNDVYSELAAISAADTQEISTAMSKVASLAHNVNMEFETTASFLTQGIEATREAPETIGTALKTIIARFAEVKSLYTKGQLSGTDEEGETVDVNKVQTALRSAGISMNAFLKGEEGLDQVLLRLSSRWNDLDVLTQRYLLQVS